jgi:HD superfamily phosphohydrolase
MGKCGRFPHCKINYERSVGVVYLDNEKMITENNFAKHEDENCQNPSMSPELKECFSKLDSQIKGRFEYVKYCGKGKYGLVAKIKIFPDNGSQGYDRAIKFSLPENINSLDNAKLKEAREDFLSEIEALYELKHPNLPQIYEFGETEVTNENSEGNYDAIPYYIMEYLDGENLNDFIKNDKNRHLINEEFFSDLVEQTLSALLCCHQRKIIHLDIKPDNIFVASDNGKYRFVLADFGKSKNIRHIPGDEYTRSGGGIIEWIHPDLHQSLRKDRAKGKMFSEDGYSFDLYSLGKTFKFVLDKIPSLSKKDSYWNFFVNDLCWYKGYNNDYARLIWYKSTIEVFAKAQKLVNFKAIKGLPVLYDSAKNSTIRLTENETIPFPNLLKKYIDTPEFQKLRNVNQLAGTDLVYPGATHTRFVHSLGVYSKCILYVNSLLSNSLFYYLYDDSEIENLILCALLHDVGHYPFSHYFEEIQGQDKLSIHHENLTTKILSNHLSIKMALNEKYANTYLPNTKIEIAKRMCGSSLGELLGEEKRDAILKIWKGEGKYMLFKDIIASSIDCDKLDYLARDSKYAGVTYGKMIDVERFIMSLTVDYSKAVDERYCEKFPDLHLAITSKGISAVESIIHSRYSLFSEVYWHKTCRAATAMIKDAFWYAYPKITQDEFEWASLMLNDDEFLLFIAEKLGDIEIATDLLGGIRNGYNRQIYKRLITFSEAWGRQKWQKLLNTLTNDFTVIHKLKNSLICKMNKAEKNFEWKEVKKHHLIIDVPNIKIDPDFTLQVKYSDDVKGKKYYDFNNVSMSKTDINVSKKIRFFCHPDYYKQIKALGGKIDEFINEAL